MQMMQKWIKKTRAYANYAKMYQKKHVRMQMMQKLIQYFGACVHLNLTRIGLLCEKIREEFRPRREETCVRMVR